MWVIVIISMLVGAYVYFKSGGAEHDAYLKAYKGEDPAPNMGCLKVQIVSILCGFTILAIIGMFVQKCSGDGAESGESTTQVVNETPEPVDLGLPSGTYWFSANYGAQHSYENGDLVPYSDAVKLIKKVGRGCALPTRKQMKELYNKCEWTWVSSYKDSGVAGYKVKGPNGNFIFLPAVGNIKNGKRRKSNTDGDYWLADKKGAGRAYNLDFTSSTIKPNDNSPATMYFSIRPVIKM